jgi:hypothetical protein
VDVGPEWAVGFRFQDPLTGGPTLLTAQVAIPGQNGPPLYTRRM